jgi:hypothetical protein
VRSKFIVSWQRTGIVLMIIKTRKSALYLFFYCDAVGVIFINILCIGIQVSLKRAEVFVTSGFEPNLIKYIQRIDV